jgi:hypothetical protein
MRPRNQGSQGLHRYHPPQTVSVASRFDFIVDGSITGILKPNKRAYQFAIDEFSTFRNFGDASANRSVQLYRYRSVNPAGYTQVGDSGEIGEL